MDKEDTKEQEELENKYEKVLNHIRLSNSPNERPNSDNFYAHKIKTLGHQGKVEKKHTFLLK